MTETDREREREMQKIDYHKEFRPLGGTLPKDENCCACALGGSVSLCFSAFDSNSIEGSVSLRFAAFVCSVVKTCYCRMLQFYNKLEIER